MATISALRQQWKEAGYSSEAGSAAVVPPPPTHLVRLYYLTSADHAISNIALGRLKVSLVSDLNDPFELMGLSFRVGSVRVSTRDFKSNFGSCTGLLCFSEDWLNPVLWSHYGARHRGMCLGFNVTRARTKQVAYSEERIATEFEEGDGFPVFDADMQEALLCTKYLHWQYERERRMLMPLDQTIREGNLFFYPFGNDLQLAEVVLGPACTHSVDAVRSLVQARYPQAVTFGSRLADKWFSVVPKESTLPAK